MLGKIVSRESGLFYYELLTFSPDNPKDSIEDVLRTPVCAPQHSFEFDCHPDFLRFGRHQVVEESKARRFGLNTSLRGH